MAIQLTPRTNATAPRAATYTVRPGDTLFAIAQRALGDGNRWRELAAANAAVKDPRRLRVGLVLRLPAVPAQAKPTPTAPVAAGVNAIPALPPTRARAKPLAAAGAAKQDRLQLSPAAKAPEKPAAPAGKPAVTGGGAASGPVSEARMRAATQTVVKPMADKLIADIRRDPALVADLARADMTPEQKLDLLRRLAEATAKSYGIKPVKVESVKADWQGGAYDFGGDRRFTVTSALLAVATPGTLVYLAAHELMHAYQEQLIDGDVSRAPGALGELARAWKANAAAYVGFDARRGNHEAYAEQPIEYGAYLIGNHVERQLLGTNSHAWGTDDVQADDLVGAR